PIDPKIAAPPAVANAPRLSASAGSSENRAASLSQSGAYSKLVVSPPRRAWRCSVPTRLRPGAKSIWTSMSSDIACLPGSGQPHPLRQIVGGDCEAGFVPARLGKLAEAVEKA